LRFAQLRHHAVAVDGRLRHARAPISHAIAATDEPVNESATTTAVNRTMRASYRL
jgi:hypothetical protein